VLLQKKVDLLESWAQSGCLVQVTAASFLGRFGKQAKAFADRAMQGLKEGSPGYLKAQDIQFAADQDEDN